MCGKSRCLLRDFSKRRWESAFFADFHGRCIFHQALSQCSIPPASERASGVLSAPPSWVVLACAQMAPFHNAYCAVLVHNRLAMKRPGQVNGWDGSWLSRMVSTHSDTSFFSEFSLSSVGRTTTSPDYLEPDSCNDHRDCKVHKMVYALRRYRPAGTQQAEGNECPRP